MSYFYPSFRERSDDPPDEPEICDICLNFVDDCVCPECDECGSVGNPKCIGDHMPISEWDVSFEERVKNNDKYEEAPR
jgi:hypothetical protein